MKIAIKHYPDNAKGGVYLIDNPDLAISTAVSSLYFIESAKNFIPVFPICYGQPNIQLFF